MVAGGLMTVGPSYVYVAPDSNRSGKCRLDWIGDCVCPPNNQSLTRIPTGSLHLRDCMGKGGWAVSVLLPTQETYNDYNDRVVLIFHPQLRQLLCSCDGIERSKVGAGLKW